MYLENNVTSPDANKHYLYMCVHVGASRNICCNISEPLYDITGTECISDSGACNHAIDRDFKSMWAPNEAMISSGQSITLFPINTDGGESNINFIKFKSVCGFSECIDFVSITRNNDTGNCQMVRTWKYSGMSNIFTRILNCCPYCYC